MTVNIPQITHPICGIYTVYYMRSGCVYRYATFIGFPYSQIKNAKVCYIIARVHRFIFTQTETHNAILVVSITVLFYPLQIERTSNLLM